MSVKITNQLNQKETKEIIDIIDSCRQFDKTKSKSDETFANDMSPNLPKYFLYTENNKILGFIYAYIPSFDTAYISAYTMPASRNRGIFRTLFGIVSDVLGNAGIKKLRFSIESNSESGNRNVRKYDNITFDKCDYILSTENYTSKIPYNKLRAQLITRDMEGDLKVFYNSLFGNKKMVYHMMNWALHAGHEGYFMFDRDEVVGIFTLRSEIHSVVLDGISVHEDLRKKGYGLLIMDYALKRALQMKKSVLIECGSDNSPALNLFRSVGFKEIYRTDYYTCELSQSH